MTRGVRRLLKTNSWAAQDEGRGRWERGLSHGSQFLSVVLSFIKACSVSDTVLNAQTSDKPGALDSRTSDLYQAKKAVYWEAVWVAFSPWASVSSFTPSTAIFPILLHKNQLVENDPISVKTEKPSHVCTEKSPKGHSKMSKVVRSHKFFFFHLT